LWIINVHDEVFGKKIGASVAITRTQNEIMSNWEEAQPLVSICCITYNHLSYLREAIDSFLMQETSFPFEIIVHDDASTDGTTEIVLEYAKKYPNIIRVIIQSQNQYSKGGLINPRFVFPKARGKFIALCEGDDYWTDKTKLQKQVDFLENNPEYVITYSDAQPFDENGLLDVNYGGAKKDLDSIELKKAIPIFTLTTCFRNVIKEIPHELISARFGDLVMWSLLGHYGKGKYLPDIMPAAYRVHDEGVFSKKTIKQKHEMRVITNAALFTYYTRIRDRKLSQHYKREILKTTLLSLGWVGVYRYFLSILLRQVKQLYNKIAGVV